MAKRVVIEETIIDKVVRYFDPVRGLHRQKARYQSALNSAYFAADRNRRPTKNWKPVSGDADSDILPDLPALRERSRDLIRNAPIATGAINTKVTNIIGGGLRLHCRIDRDFLGMSDEEADAWEADTQREFRLWAESSDCSADRGSDFYGLQSLAFRSAFENGDCFSLLPLINRGRAYDLAVQLVEADRVSNEDDQKDTDKLKSGIECDQYGAPVQVHIRQSAYNASKKTWQKVPVFGKESGRRNVLHICNRLRIGQKRGVPALAPVIEALKQLSDYTEAEIAAAVVAGMFTVFVESEGGGATSPLSDPDDTESPEIKLSNAAIIDLAPGEKISTANPGRPNSGFDPFVMSILRQIGVAIEVPLELLIMHFTASYSASRAALEQAWKSFKTQRGWMASTFCNPIYAEWMTEAVEKGRIIAPGFLDGDPAIRDAYLRCIWIGPAKGHIQPMQEIQAEKIAVEMGSKTLDEVTAETTGGDWEEKHRQRSKEVRMRKADGLILDTTTPSKQSGMSDENNQPADFEDQDKIDNEEKRK